ncbi:hypothetical protein HUU62_03240 [Rhodoferax sp. 4810]|nr:hypothetical protein [Rhodoferax jenense]
MITRVIFCILLSGCSAVLPSGQKKFSPPPMEYERWVQPTTDTDYVVIQKAMLECGATDPFGNNKQFAIKNKNENLNRWVGVEKCMKKSGFLIKPGLESNICQNFSYIDLCQSQNTILIPSRDASRRLNSPFCKDPIYAKNKTCQP